MCRSRQVRNVYKACGHAQTLPEQFIQCDSRYCRFSSTHPSNCVPPNCTRTCAQYRQFPEQYSPQINGYCPTCTQTLGRR